MAGVCSQYNARCDWLFLERDSPVMPTDITSHCSCPTKKESKRLFKTIVPLSKLQQLQKMSDNEHSKNEFYYPDELKIQKENKVVALNFGID